jgi:hypothetical protein
MFLKNMHVFFYVDGATKLTSFVSNSVNVFQVRHGVIRQIQDKFVFHLEGIHYMTHHTNLMVETLFKSLLCNTSRICVNHFIISFFTTQKNTLSF